MGIFGKKAPHDVTIEVHQDLTNTKEKLLKQVSPSATYWDLLNGTHDLQSVALKHLQEQTMNGTKPMPPERPPK